MKVKVKKWGINGEGIAFVKRKPMFIPYVLPNEVIECHIVSEKQKYILGEMDRLVEKSSRRRHPICSLWQSCGGCALMHTQYKEQCKMKEQMVKEALYKYAGYRGTILPIIKNPNPLGYRNLCKLPLKKVNDHWKTGMYASQSQDLVVVDRCIIHEKSIEEVRKQLLVLFDQYQLNGLLSLVLKTFDQRVQVILVTEPQTLSEELIQSVLSLESVCSFWQSVKTDDSVDVFGQSMVHLGGETHMNVNFDKLKLQLLPRSFFQLNTQQAFQLYRLVADWVPQSNLLVEAFSGIGAIGLFSAHKAKEIIGIEYNLDAVKNAQENAKNNGFDHIHFYAGDASEKVKQIERPIDTLIVDPPRKGLEGMTMTLLETLPKHLIYVSCNPSTLGKDLNRLKKSYRIEKVQPFDLFSQTPLVETVVFLKRRA